LGYPEGGGSKLLHNNGAYKPAYMTSCPGRLESSSALLGEPLISLNGM